MMRATRLARRGWSVALICGAMLIGFELGATAVAAQASTARVSGVTGHVAVTHKTPLAPTCNTASVALIKKTLGIVVAAPRRSASGKTFLCEYGNSRSSLALVIEYNLVGSASNYKTVRSGYDANAEPTTSLRSLGPLANEAFTASLGTGALANYSVFALQKKLEVLVASYIGIPKLVALMRQILTVS